MANLTESDVQASAPAVPITALADENTNTPARNTTHLRANTESRFCNTTPAPGAAVVAVAVMYIAASITTFWNGNACTALRNAALSAGNTAFGSGNTCTRDGNTAFEPGNTAFRLHVMPFRVQVTPFRVRVLPLRVPVMPFPLLVTVA